jgi:hypothetical protein
MGRKMLLTAFLATALALPVGVALGAAGVQLLVP